MVAVPNPRAYSSLIFDCDGVLLDSNRVKTAAFYEAALPFGSEVATRLVEYHKSLGGISRYEKFRYLLDHLVDDATRGPSYGQLLQRYARSVEVGLREARVAEALRELKAHTSESSWIVVSGSDQNELRRVLETKNIAHMFVGIFGSPDSKTDILAREFQAGTACKNALFLGDSRHDHEVARAYGLDFVFVSGWTEFEGWRAYCAAQDIQTIDRVADLVPRSAPQ
ncbi:MAG: HAD hydrolase-like protein [Myxococcota bacterium]